MLLAVVVLKPDTAVTRWLKHCPSKRDGHPDVAGVLHCDWYKPPMAPQQRFFQRLTTEPLNVERLSLHACACSIFVEFAVNDPPDGQPPFDNVYRRCAAMAISGIVFLLTARRGHRALSHTRLVMCCVRNLAWTDA
jgi:hypothetical protein